MKLYHPWLLAYLWSPDSWRQRSGLMNYQVPSYPDQSSLFRTMNRLRDKAPLVFAGEIRKLRQELIHVANNQSIVLIAGDCAESFYEFSGTKVRKDLSLLMRMALILGFASGKKTVQIGRTAGQFAKPRSTLFESHHGVVLDNYFGDIINDSLFSEKERRPDPERMLSAYHQSVQTLNLIRAFLQGDFSSFHNFKQNHFDVIDTPVHLRYRHMIHQIDHDHHFRWDNFFTGHECLLLPYEEPLTRIDSITGKYYDCSAHFLWLGERTRKLDAEQVEFLRGIENPIGIKVSDSWDESILDLIEILDPHCQPGKIVIMTRMGYQKIDESLPPLVSFLEDACRNRRRLIWICDPMHGNTISVSGIKTRSIHHIHSELQSFVRILRQQNVSFGGIHLETTSKDVTECFGGDVHPVQLSQIENSTYDSLCDPRLNRVQSLETAFFVGNLIFSNMNKE